MNKGELKTLILTWAHRTDLAGVVDQFVDNTTQRLNKRLGLALYFNDDLSTNIISEDYPEIYLYGGLREMAIYTADAPATQIYDAIYKDEVDRLNVTAESTGFVDDTPAIQSEYEQLVEEANATP